MCWSEMGNYKVFMKFYMMKIKDNIAEAVEEEEKEWM